MGGQEGAIGGGLKGGHGLETKGAATPPDSLSFAMFSKLKEPQYCRKNFHFLKCIHM